MIALVIMNIAVAELNLHSDRRGARYAAAFCYFAAGICASAALMNFIS